MRKRPPGAPVRQQPDGKTIMMRSILIAAVVAMQHYQRALMLNPRHRSAHKHLGEAFLARGDLVKAKQHLATLEQICLIPCDEYDDLKRAIAEYDKVANR